MTARPPFLMALWIAIVVALVSALAPLGPPSSRVTGSAFNPATTSVVIKAARPFRSLVKAAIPDDRHKPPVHAAPMVCLLTLAVLLCAFTRVKLRAIYSFSRGALGRSAFLSRQHARAPPQFS